jgi:protein-disulfide isomerase
MKRVQKRFFFFDNCFTAVKLLRANSDRCENHRRTFTIFSRRFRSARFFIENLKIENLKKEKQLVLRILASMFSTILFCFVGFSQDSEILATANGRSYTIEDLSPEAQQRWKNLPQQLSQLRLELLNQMILINLLDMEAKARKISVEKLLQVEIDSKLPNPSEAEIKAIYEAHKERIGEKSLEEMRKQIIDFLKHQEKMKALEALKKKLEAKYKVRILADVNSNNLKPSDVLAMIGNKKIFLQDFEQANLWKIYDEKLYAFNHLYNALEEKIFNDLIIEEASARNIATNDLIAQEVTNKMKEFSDEENEELMEILREGLFEKYGVKIFLKGAEQFVQKISVDGSPSKGPMDAPVTIVMFSDFQCSACAAAHPMLQKVIEPYGNKVRFVVRYFPLEMHKDAFVAAQAAHAAYLQGKFFEYIEILYSNQQSLDIKSLRKYALQLGLDLKKFDIDMRSPKTKEKIERDVEEGKSHGVVATPTVFVNGVRVLYDQLSPIRLRRIIKKALKEQTANKELSIKTQITN